MERRGRGGEDEQEGKRRMGRGGEEEQERNLRRGRGGGEEQERKRRREGGAVSLDFRTFLARCSSHACVNVSPTWSLQSGSVHTC